MSEIINVMIDQKKLSLRQSLVQSGYDMAASQAEMMSEDEESWGMHMIEGKINPNCIDISDQASHSFYCNELDIWFEPDEVIFPEGCNTGGINELIAINGISDEEVFELLEEGASLYLCETYGKDWKDKYPEPEYNSL